VLAVWKDDYNIAPPHSAPGDLTPAEFADRSAEKGFQKRAFTALVNFPRLK
jgi:hypothetical protein